MYQRDFNFIQSKDNLLLSVVLMTDSFFYSVFDLNNVILAHKSYDDIRYSDPEFINAIKADQNLKADFRKVSVVVLAGISQQLPIVNEKAVAHFPNLSLTSNKIEKIAGNDAYTYFGLTTHQENLLNDVLGSGRYVIHHISNLLSSYYIESLGQTLHTHIEKDEIFIFHQSEGKFKFYNSFLTSAINDVLYFILAVYKETGLDPKTDTCTLSGWIEKNSPLFTLIYGYINNLSIVYIESEFKISSDTELKKHFYFIHYANAICAS
jgi:hypothetical protein